MSAEVSLYTQLTTSIPNYERIVQKPVGNKNQFTSRTILTITCLAVDLGRLGSAQVSLMR